MVKSLRNGFLNHRVTNANTKQGFSVKSLIDLRLQHPDIKAAFPNTCIDVVDRMAIAPVKDLVFSKGIKLLQKLNCPGIVTVWVNQTTFNNNIKDAKEMAKYFKHTANVYNAFNETKVCLQ